MPNKCPGVIKCNIKQRSDLAVSEHRRSAVQVRHSDISRLGVSCCSVVSRVERCYKSSGSEHSGMAKLMDKKITAINRRIPMTRLHLIYELIFLSKNNDVPSCVKLRFRGCAFIPTLYSACCSMCLSNEGLKTEVKSHSEH